MRLPNFILATRQGRKAVYHYTAYDSYLLIIFTANTEYSEIETIKTNIKAATSSYPRLLNTLTVINSTLSPSSFNNNKGWPDNIGIDVEAIHQKLNINHPTAILVRPDNYIACILGLDEMDTLKTYLQV